MEVRHLSTFEDLGLSYYTWLWTTTSIPGGGVSVWSSPFIFVSGTPHSSRMTGAHAIQTSQGREASIAQNQRRRSHQPLGMESPESKGRWFNHFFSLSNLLPSRFSLVATGSNLGIDQPLLCRLPCVVYVKLSFKTKVS